MAYTPGQKLPAAQLNASFGAKADQTALNSVSVIAASAKTVTDAISNATAPDAGALNGTESVIISRGAGVLETALSAIQTFLAATFAKIADLANASDITKGAALIGYAGTGGTIADALSAVQLADFAALRAYAGSNKNAYVTGYSFSAPSPTGISGNFTRDDTDSVSADNGGTIIIDALNRRWKRNIINGVITPDMFGALGGAADDTAAVQAAMNVALSASGGQLLLTQKYRISAALVIPQWDGFLLRGASRLSAGLVQTAANTPIFRFTKENAHSFTIKTMSLSALTAQPFANKLAVGIYFDTDTQTGAGVYNFTVEDILFDNLYRGIGNNTANSQNMWGCTLDMLWGGLNMSGSLIAALPNPTSGQPNIKIGSIYIRGDAMDVSEAAVDLAACGSVTIDNLEINLANNGSPILRATAGTRIVAANVRLERGTYTANNSCFIRNTDSYIKIGQLEVTGSTIMNVGAGNKLWVVDDSGGTGSATDIDILAVGVTATSGTAFMYRNGYGRVARIWAMSNIFLSDIIATTAADRTRVDEWLNDRVSADNGDTSVTLSITPGKGNTLPFTVQQFSTPLTANRTIKLPEGSGGSNANIFNGLSYEIIVNASSPGAFTLAVQTATGGAIYTIPASQKYSVKVVWRRFTWVVERASVIS